MIGIRHLDAIDLLVVGAGAVGASTALAAARRGARVAIVEASRDWEATGSSKGAARIYAPAAYPDEEHLGIALRALRRWRELEVNAGDQLLASTGVVNRGAFAERQLPALRAAGVSARLVSAEWAREELGVGLDGEAPLVHQPDAGVIRADRALDALLRAARGAGVDLNCAEKVRRISPRGDGVLVETTLGTRKASAVVVAAGPWSRALLRTAGIEVAQDVSVQSVAYFRCYSADSHSPTAVIDYEGDEPYACWDGGMGLKAALHARGPEAEPPEAADSISPAVVARVTEWVQGRYAALRPALRASGTCLYTNTPDERSAIERHGRVVSAAACNGQGFQLAPESGDRAADLAIEAAGAPIAEEWR